MKKNYSIFILLCFLPTLNYSTESQVVSELRRELKKEELPFVLDINQPIDAYGTTLLFYAINTNNLKLARCLLNNNATIFKKNLQGYTAWDYAKAKNNHFFTLFKEHLKKRKLRIGILTTWNIRCGIAMYIDHIYQAMKKNDYDPIILPYDLSLEEILRQVKNLNLEIINIQYEPSLFNDNRLTNIVSTLKKNNLKVFITVHWEKEILQNLEKLIDHFIYHKLPKLNIKKFTFVPMGVPVFNPISSKQEARIKYKYNVDDIIITTAGFLLPWKEYPSILEKLSPIIKSNPKYKVQFLTSINDSAKNECLNELRKINRVVRKNKLQKQVNIITDFLPQYEYSERLWMSDIGYLWGSLQSQGSSASLKEFISARLPLITTNCSHFHDIKLGIIKTNVDKDSFISTIQACLNNKGKINILRQELEVLYQRLNYNNLIKRYIRIFKKGNR